MINWIMRRKVVMIEDVAAEFGLTTNDTVTRLEQLEG